MVKYFIIIILILPSSWCFSQETKLADVIVSIAEELAADDTDPESFSTYIEKLYELVENPVKLNSAGKEEISRLFFLSDFQVKALADYSHSLGRIISVYELANIPGFDKGTVEMMLPFITLDSKMIINSDSAQWRNTLITNLFIRSGNKDTASYGSGLRLLTKYKFTVGSFSGGLTAEKDPGEKLLTGNIPLPDFYSAYIAYNGSGLIRRLILGDYSARFGQGTNINTGIRTGLSLTSPGYMSARDEIKPYSSSDENNFFRGMAAELSYQNLGLTFFYSKNYLDATISLSPGSAEAYIENFYLAGVHNTPSLALKKDAVSELAYGINLSYNFKNVRIGLTWSGNRFSLPVKQTGNNPADIFDFTGDRSNLYTISYNGIIKRILLYGEFSSNENKKYALVQGLSFRPSDRLSLNFLLRNYNAGYMSFHGKGPGSISTAGSEQGILGNFTFEAARHLFISGGCDIRNFSWLKYRCSSPSSAVRRELRVCFLPTEKLTIDASYNYRSSMVDEPAANRIPVLKEIITRSLRGSVRYSLYENLTLGTRIDYKVVDQSGNKGLLILEDINFRFRSIPVSIWLRYCIFSTDDYESRLYTWENDMLYSFSIPALYGKGNRMYLMTGWKMTDKAELRFKYAISTNTRSPDGFRNTEEFRIQIKLAI